MRNKCVTILLSSENEAKISSVRKVCTELFPNFSLYHYNVTSGISETPEDDDEAIKGCHNRIENIEKETSSIHADYIIALEGLINKSEFGAFVYGWAVIKETGVNKYYYGCSGKVMLPSDITSKLSKNVKLSDLVLDLYPQFSDDDLKKLGTNGVLTHGLYTRVQEFETALKCAFGSLVVQRGGQYGQADNF
jgi:non-canonical (house-cleaning) NTP pyrophosphatase